MWRGAFGTQGQTFARGLIELHDDAKDHLQSKGRPLTEHSSANVARSWIIGKIDVAFTAKGLGFVPVEVEGDANAVGVAVADGVLSDLEPNPKSGKEVLLIGLKINPKSSFETVFRELAIHLIACGLIQDKINARKKEGTKLASGELEEICFRGYYEAMKEFNELLGGHLSGWVKDQSLKLQSEALSDAARNDFEGWVKKYRNDIEVDSLLSALKLSSLE